jgi:enoyl-CoA hydratase/carnithine racemase
MKMEFVRLDKDGPVAILTMAHEEENRFTTAFLAELLSALDACAADDFVRAVVVTAAQERFFCSGLHLAWMIEEGAKGPGGLVAFLERFRELLVGVTGFPKPLVGAIGGHVAAAGVVFAAGFDYRLMNADRGKVRLPEVHMNLEFLPGAMALLRDILPPRSLRDLLYPGQAVTGAEAHRLGFVDALHHRDRLIHEAIELARSLGTAQLPTYAHVKRGLRQGVLQVMETEDRAFIRKKGEELRAVFGR